MKKYLIHILLSISLWPACPLVAQVKATVDKQRILIGEPIHLMLEATVTGNNPLIWPSLDSLPHFEFEEKMPVDSTISPSGRYYRQYLTVTSFDSGVWSIPRLPFVTGKRTLLTDSILIRIIYTKIDPSKDYHDIRDIVEIPNLFARWFGWIVAAFSVISAGLVVWLLRKRKVLQVLVPRHPPPRLSPYEEAIRQLDELAGQRLPENGAVKTFYSRLSDIFRIYLYRRVGIASLAETSEELIGQLRRQGLPQQQFTDLAEALRMGDFVKFAKYQPGLAESDSHYRIIRGTIEELDQKLEMNDLAQAAITGQPVARPTTGAQNREPSK